MNQKCLLPALLATTLLAACGNPPTPPAYNPPASTPPASAPAPATPPAATTPPAAAPAADGTAAATDAPAAPAPADVATASAPAPAAAAHPGEAIYNQGCQACHATGVTGAPIPGDAADWGPRIAQGEALLLEHAIKGYTGSKGMMPPKGGFMHLSDAQVADAVRYMVSKSQ